MKIYWQKFILIVKAIINSLIYITIKSPFNKLGVIFLKKHKIGGLRKEKKYGRQQSDFTW